MKASFQWQVPEIWIYLKLSLALCNLWHSYDSLRNQRTGIPKGFSQKPHLSLETTQLDRDMRTWAHNQGNAITMPPRTISHLPCRKYLKLLISINVPLKQHVRVCLISQKLQSECMFSGQLLETLMTREYGIRAGGDASLF